MKLRRKNKGSEPNTPQPGALDKVQETKASTESEGKDRPGLPMSVMTPKDYQETHTDSSPVFGAVDYRHTLVGLDQSTPIRLCLFSKIDRGFFLHGQDWTCYRRNYFQVTASFSIQGLATVNEGQAYPCYLKRGRVRCEAIERFTIAVGAKVHSGEKSVPLVQHTPKRDKGPQTTPRPKPIRPSVSPQQANARDQSLVTYERLQFVKATPNNGKKRVTQELYVITLELHAILSNGKEATLASTVSPPMVVRGRSPGHYAETPPKKPRRKAVPRGPSPPPPQCFPSQHHYYSYCYYYNYHNFNHPLPEYLKSNPAPFQAAQPPLPLPLPLPLPQQPQPYYWQKPPQREQEEPHPDWHRTHPAYPHYEPYPYAWPMNYPPPPSSSSSSTKK
ncbi:hypothetical protein BY458DRAFT_506549 [Sporodiniella umbellata]|nr:hypothetical protein BY458DRAFT_506549 [Sporodiniella umbellata]